MTPDPLGPADGPNLYTYVGNDPLNWVDPLGYMSQKHKIGPEMVEPREPEEPEEPVPPEPEPPFRETLKILYEQHFGPIEPIKDNSLKEHLRVLKEMIEKLGPWI